VGLVLFAWFAAPAAAQGPAAPAAPTAAQLRATAEAAEAAGDWEKAFAAYCQLFVADRGSPEVREKLHLALRRTQQLRRHRDPQFLRYVASVSPTDAEKLFAEVLTKVPVRYVDRHKATPQILWENGVAELSRALSDPAFRQAFLADASADKVEGFRAALRVSWAKGPVATAADARTLLKKMTAAAQEAFPVRVPSALVLEVVCGACDGLDEYTVFLTPAQFHPDATPTAADLSAQGVYLAPEDGSLVVAGVAPGSWAKHHYPLLRKGDRVARINGRDMVPATLVAAAEALRNPLDGWHELEVGPDEEVVVVRLPVVVPTVYRLVLSGAKDEVGYVRIGSFSATTPRELDETLNALKAEGVRAVVLDLRGNMGGSFLSGVDTAKRLIPSGTIVTTRGQVAQVDNQSFESDSGMSAHDIPVVVLVDADTASAAEVLAAALKDRGRATLVGMPTFGKGAIQYPFRFDALDEKDDRGRPKTNRTGGVRLTIARLHSPDGSPINGVGVTPHVLEAHPARQLEVAFQKAFEALPPLPRVTPPVMMMPAAP
jgi:C-terminal peptidase prc